MPDTARYQLAQVGESPAHRTPPYWLGDLLFALGVLQALGDRTQPLFVFLHGEAQARAIWCPQCGRVSWNKGDVVNYFCGFCHKFYRC
jgi:hypothetical protein